MSGTRRPRRSEHEVDAVVEVRPSLWRLAVPLNGHALGHVSVYVLEDAAGLTLVDTGWGLPPVRQALSEMLASIGRSLEDVRTVLLTHVHADHAGLAGEIQRRSGARVLLHRADADQIGPRHRAPDEYAEATRGWLAATGVPSQLWNLGLAQVRNERARFADVFPDEVLEGERSSIASTLVAVHTPGHTAGHLCFHDPERRLLFSGDTVFRRINYGPTLRPFAAPDPLGAYLESLDRLTGLEVDLVLPGHGGPFPDLRARLRELRAHHDRRSGEIRRLVGEGASTVWDVAGRVARSQAWSSLSVGRRLSATGDAYAHLLHLVQRGLVQVDDGAPLRWKLSPGDGGARPARRTRGARPSRRAR